ncbi:alpha/beta hydrolase [Aurantivibrio infirmus]
MPTFSYQETLHYFDSNPNSTCESILLLHGLGSRAVDWQPQIDALRDNYRVIALDFPGHGESEAAKENLSMKTLAARVSGLMEHLQLASAHVIGLSLGGMVAFQLAVDFPKYIRSLVIINSAPGPGSSNASIMLKLLMRKALLKIIGIEKLAKKIAVNLFPHPSQKNLREQFLDSMALVDKTSYRNIVKAIGEYNIDSEVEGCPIPTLILAADQDYTSVEFKKSYAGKMRNARVVVVPNSRHASTIDSPDFCNREIKEFLLSLQ